MIDLEPLLRAVVFLLCAAVAAICIMAILLVASFFMTITVPAAFGAIFLGGCIGGVIGVLKVS